MIALVTLWVVMAPLYQPYFRLLLPFSLATFVLAGVSLPPLVEGSASRGSIGRALGTLATPVALSVAVLMPRFIWPWLDTRSLANAAGAIDAKVPAGVPVAVIGEPSLAFYLHRRGHHSFDRSTLRELDASGSPVLVVTGVYARKAQVLRDGLRDRAHGLEILGRYPVDPSDLRLLDDYGSVDAPRYRARPDSMYDLILYRYDPSKRNVGNQP
jgi:hypothetical protein